MATIAMSGPLSTRMTTNENATESHSLSLLSSIAAIVPDDPNEKLHRQKRQDGLSSARTPIVNLNSIKGSRKRKGSGILSSLSRSVSSKNLQESVVTSFSPPSRKRRKQQQSQHSVHDDGTRIGSISIVPCSLVSATTVEESPTNSTENGTERQTIASGERNTALVKTISSTDATIHSPSDDILSNVYRAYEMQLPDTCDNGNALWNDSNSKNDEVVDDYNYYVISSTPLRIPPRLPSASESFAIAERSREEKSNWGWFI